MEKILFMLGTDIGSNFEAIFAAQDIDQRSLSLALLVMEDI
jgi:hypothetical protein